MQLRVYDIYKQKRRDKIQRHTSTGKSQKCMPMDMMKRRGKMIKVQPTAESRQKYVLGGRRCLQTGRKPGQSSAEYKTKNVGASRGLCLKRKKRKAPHSLSRCVENNENIGKSHSSKW